MKPSNFPGRKNARRMRALGRLEVDTSTAIDGSPLRPRAERNAEADALALRIMPQERAEAIRTKKTPAALWSDARRAWRSGRIVR